MRTAFLVVAMVALVGCAGPREHAEEISIPTNPLRKSRVGDICRYRAVRDNGQGKSVSEVWTFEVTGAGKGLARVDVAVLGPDRDPKSPSPREPAYAVILPTADQPLAGTEILQVFHRPDLRTEGMLVVLGRDVKSVDGSTRAFAQVVLGRTRDVRELTVTVTDAQLLHGTYRVVVSDDLPVLGISEAELEEEWQVVDKDGQLHTEQRHERLELVEAHGAADAK
jgi:hypothetical protein